MKSKQPSPIWPYLGILAFLFVLSLTAPRAWDRKSRQKTDWPPAEGPRAEAPVALDRVVAVESDEQNHLDLLETETQLVVEPALPPPDNSPSDADQQPAANEIVEIIQPEPEFAMIPPAPEFAEEVRDTLELAHRPAVPAPVPTMDPPQEEAPVEPHDDRAALATSAWPLPRVLLEQLTSLTHDDPQLIWPVRAISLVHELCGEEADYPATTRILEQLRDLATHDATAPAADSSMATQITRARYALERWLDVWGAAAALREVPIAKLAGRPTPETVRVCLADFDASSRDETAKHAWRDYLQLEALESAAGRSNDEDRRQAARAVLDRLASRRLSQAQRRFVADGPLAELQEELRGWAAEPVSAERLLADLERYEYTRLASDGWRVANDFRSLHWSAPEEAEQLSRQLHTHYRNANVRAAVAGILLNRIVPQPGRIDAPVRGTVVDVPVRGASSTFAELSLELIPDARRIRLGLEARGIVASNTISTSGPATFRNRGQSTFLARKLFVLGPKGLNIWPAIAEAENNYNSLVSLETNFDAVPLVGSLVRTIARNQHDELREQARRQTAEKVAIRALHQLDSEAEAQVAEAARKVEDKQLATLRRLGLELTPISLSTTEERIVARARLAGPEQLGAHTPRPRAPSDSWLSLQLHQSALNNGLEQLDLNGRTFEISELFAWVAEKLGRPELAEIEELPEDVQLTFADKNAVRLSCEDGRVRVTFALAKLTHGRKRWRDFEVYTTYAPAADGLAPRFVRNDTIHLAGRSMRGKLELKLRAIFSKVLSKKRDLRLLGESITGDSRLADLQITQFAIEDGWIALAYSPRRKASEVARQSE